MTLQGVSEPTLRLLQSLGIIVTALIGSASLLLAAWSARKAAKVASVSNLFTITAAHRDIWRQYALRDELQHVLDWDTEAEQLTPDEQRFLQEVVLHLNASWLASREGTLPRRRALSPTSASCCCGPSPERSGTRSAAT